MNQYAQGDLQRHLLFAQVFSSGKCTQHLLENDRDIYFLGQQRIGSSLRFGLGLMLA